MTFNANGILKQRLELSKLLQNRCIDVARLSETYEISWEIHHLQLRGLSDRSLS